MAYSDFTLTQVLRRFNLKHDDKTDLFSAVEATSIHPALQRTLNHNTRLALGASTEKARSEFIIAPILSELSLMADGKISVFSGSDFTVEPENGLNGACDFIISKSDDQTVITAPILIIVEAKNENMRAGLGQCIATMVAAQKFNQREENNIPAILGVVTTGNNWRFLKLSDNLVQTDVREYYLNELNKIFGILANIIEVDMVVTI
jgi:hypothetical protein